MEGSTPLATDAMVLALCGTLLALVLFVALQGFVWEFLITELKRGKLLV